MQLVGLLSELPHAHLQEKGGVSLAAIDPSEALPLTTFMQADVPFPQLLLEPGVDLSLGVGNLGINTNTTINQESLPLTTHQLPLSDLVERLKGHLLRIDHTGVNVPTTLVSQEEWQKFIRSVAEQTNLYKYPTTDTWLFVVPATEEEHAADITHFPLGRKPRFELVYDGYSSIPTIQIDIETDLTRKEVEELFPDPYGVSFPELEDFFRTVYVRHEWPGLLIRFDLRFKTDQPGDWETGKWLVQEGGRVYSD